MGIIDSFSEYSLYDVVDGTLPEYELENGDVINNPTVEYQGIHIVPQSKGTYLAQLDGHAGHVETIESDEYDDVLELIDDLNSIVARWHEFDYQNDKESLVEWAGRILTRDRDKADDSDLYMYIGG